LGTGDIAVITRLIVGALCTFFAILLSSKTREPAWLFIIFGVICTYVQVVLLTLEGFGIFDTKALLYGVPVLQIAIENVPLAFIATGLVLAVRSKSKY
jgi:hypothetical protein